MRKFLEMISPNRFPVMLSPQIGAAQPSYENALQYFINAQLWAKENGIEMYYFSAFDEPWKVGAEGDVGAFWGLWDKDENIKFSL